MRWKTKARPSLSMVSTGFGVIAMSQPYTDAMPQIFISYRRTDAGGHAGRLHELLRSHYSDADLFFDVAGIGDGRDWETEIKKHLEECDVLLVVIGRDWLSARDPESFQRRIDQPGDWVRLEVETGLAMDKVLIPVLVDGAHLPANAGHLPASIRELLKKQARDIPHKDAETAVGLLVEQIKKRFPKAAAARKNESQVRDSPDLLQQKRLDAVERLWAAVLDLRKRSFAPLLFFGILLPSEYDSAFHKPGSLNAALKSTTDESIADIAESVEDVEAHRPYLGDELWGLFFVYRSYLLRLAALLVMGKRDGHISDWREDQPLIQMLTRVIPPETMNGLLSPKEDLTAVNRADGVLQSMILAKVQLVTSGRHQFNVEQTVAARSRTDELRQELEPLIESFVAAGGSGNAQLLQRAWNNWVAWLQANRLQFLPRNQKILNTWAIYGDQFHSAGTQANVSLWAERIAMQIKDTQFTHE
jgi:hypothetical protein